MARSRKFFFNRSYPLSDNWGWLRGGANPRARMGSLGLTALWPYKSRVIRVDGGAVLGGVVRSLVECGGVPPPPLLLLLFLLRVNLPPAVV